MSGEIRNLVALAAASLLWTTTPVVRAETQDDVRFGTVHFQTSCSDVAQRRFDRAMRYEHSFWYGEARQIFEEALAADPGCAIAHWGIALSLLLNPHIATPKSNLAPGLAALEKAKTLGARTQRERDYIDALTLLYADHDKLAYQQRAQKYLQAMEALAQRYPEDDEAQIAYALALSVTAPPHDKTYAYQLKGAAILEPIFKRQPRHPGVAHYLIHLYDFPPIAEKGLEAAERYAAIAPAAPHALHMPSHIFTRVGSWKESIETNAASAKAAKSGKEWQDLLHAMDYLVYAHLQLAQDEQARAVVDEMVATRKFNPNIRTGPYAIAASEARYTIERRDWKGAAALPVRPSKFAYVDAITHFARALGEARVGDLDGAKADIARLAALADALRGEKDAYWSEQVDIQKQVATAWLLEAQGQREQALATLGTAADAEDKTEKSIVTPGPLAPARELYGEMLLEHGDAAGALAQFEAVLRKEPNRFDAFAGAAAAAERMGDMGKAKHYAQKLLAAAADGGSSRPVIAAARRLTADH